MGPIDPAASRRLESLPARPPTPPREINHEPEAPPKQVFLLDPCTSLQTPPSIHSPLSGSKIGSTGSRKKVEFSARTDYQEAPVYPDDIGTPLGRRRIASPVVAIPPSSSASRPAKSILKATSYATSIPYDSTQPASPVSIADMLASTVQQLAGADRDSKLDAYLTLARALKASDNLPDRIALQAKMSLFTQFIQRDITSKTPAGTLDSTLVLAALDLLNTFLRFSAIASTLSNDFGVFIIDHCIRSFEVVEVSRTVLRALMRVVGLQSFSAKVMTSDRVGRLVVALHNMEEQMESRNTLLLRCMIYQRLVKNHKIPMAQHLDWLPDLFTDMLSSVPFIREAAINLGLDAGYSLARERPVTQRVIDLFQTTVDDEAYFKFYANSLLAMMKERDESSYVPQVWSVVTLFLRAPEKWEHFVPWLRIIQGCFNSSDYRTKEQANLAWCRLTYTVFREHRMPSTKMISILTKALVSQLRRRGTGKLYDDLRRVVIGTICNLYYYSMRPNAEPRVLDNLWDHSVKTVVLQLLEKPVSEEAKEKRKGSRESVSAILTGLINCSVPRPWLEDHIVKSPLVLPSDLPAIDAKWIRRNSGRVFALVGPIMKQSFLELATPRSSTQALWRAVVGAVTAAAAKEVKVSTETAVFVGHAFSLLLELWSAGSTALAEKADIDSGFASKQFIAAAYEYLFTMIDSLGSLPFTEKQLSKGESNAFVAIGTPSQRTGKGHSVARSPLYHLFSIFATLPPGVPDDGEYADFVESIFAPFFSAKSSKGRRDLALDLLQSIPIDAQCPYGPWQVMAVRIGASMDPQSSSNGGVDGTANGSNNSLGVGSGYYHFQLSPGPGKGSSSPVGFQFREIVRVLERGLRSTPNLPFSRWQTLFCILCDRVRVETGDAGLVICVLDPLAKTIGDVCASPTVGHVLSTASQAVTELLSTATQPRDRQAVDAAKRRLWGMTTATPGPASSADPLDYLYKTVNSVLELQYRGFEPQDPAFVERAALLLRQVGRFFAKGNDQLFLKTLSAVQDGLALWIQDDNTHLGRQSPAGEATKQVWEGLCSTLERVGEPDSFPLEDLETLFSAAFSSKHRQIVNRSLTLWNNVYGNYTGDINYPEKLEAALTALQPLIDASIPGVAAAAMDAGSAQQPMFVDSQETEATSLASTESGDLEVAVPQALAAYNSRSPAAVPMSLPRRHAEPLAATTPSSVNSFNGEKKGVKSAEKKKHKAPRPRHEDSQIEFTSIDSSDLFPGNPAGSSSKNAKDNTADTEESQVLTERQREVRDRQRETNALYSDIMSSSPTGSSARAWARPLMSFEAALSQPEPMHEDEQPSSPIADDVKLPEQVQTATPKAHHFAAEDFIASTPTPRRGQALTIPIQDNDNDNDPPSSPPEPRRYPLLPEMRARSHSSSSILEEWQFSSSPVSGSPMAARHTAPEPELSMEGVVEAGNQVAEKGRVEPAEDDMEPTASFASSVDLPQLPQLPQDDTTEVATESVPDTTISTEAASVLDAVVEITLIEPRRPKKAAPMTPKRLRNRSGRFSQKTTRASDGSPASTASRPLSRESQDLNETASTADDGSQSSPAHKSSSSRRRYKIMAAPSPLTLDQSFHISDGDERSMLRIAMELEHSKTVSSPAAEAVRASQEAKTGDVQMDDCITVRTGNESPERPRTADSLRPRRRKRKRAASQTRSEGSQAESLEESLTESLKTPLKAKPASQETTASWADGTTEGEPSGMPEEVSEEQEIQSQLALEFQERNERQKMREAVRAGKQRAAVASPVKEVEKAGKEEKEEKEERPAKKPKLMGILELLKSSLAMLKTAALSREEVNEIEDVCMDMKRELYDAERRGRQGSRQ